MYDFSDSGQDIESVSNKRLQEYPDGSILITDVRSTDAGNYSCRVSNIHGSDNVIYEVNVQGKELHAIKT